MSSSPGDMAGERVGPARGDLEVDLWPRLARAGRPLLALDYDGTLAPFRTERMAARLPETLRGSIEAIRDGADTVLAIVSGRPIEELLQLVELPGLILVGSHGRERRWPDGREERVLPGIEQLACLDRAVIAAEASLPAERIERKIGSVAAHTRGLAPAEGAALIDEVTRRWRGMLCQGMECRPFDGGAELRVAGQDKGSGLRRVMEHTRPDLTVYLGDDDTDEDAFRLLREQPRGYGIRVGEEGCATHAHALLSGEGAVSGFLGRWLDARQSRR